jgi:hypothetical protein
MIPVASPVSAQKAELQEDVLMLALASLGFTRTEDSVQVTLEDFRIVPSAKPVYQREGSMSEGSYACVILGKQDIPLDTLYLGNPLMPRFEYPTDTEEIGSVELPFGQNSVLIRFRYTREMQSLQMIQMGASRRWNTMAHVPLPETRR